MKCLIAICVLIFMSIPCLSVGQKTGISSSCFQSAKNGSNMFEAIPDSRPWLVLVWISCESGNHSHSLVKTCEGALIRDNWVLTVARCFQDCHDGLEFISATVDIGLHNNDVRREIVSGRNNTKRIPVEKIYLNNNNFVISSVENEMQKQLIQNMSVSNDLALLRLSVSVRDQNRVISLPNCTTEDLPSNSQSIDDFLIPESTSTASQMHSDEEALKGQGRNNREVVDESKRDSNCLINSWGGIASSATVLQEMDLRLLSRDECVQFSGDPNLSQSLVCAGVSVNNTVSVTEWERVVSDFHSDCSVQQGTPLVVPEESLGDNMERQCRWNLVGLLSFGMGCHKSTLDKSDDGHVSFSTPGFFSSVCEYIPWIEATIKQHKALVSAACPVLPQPPPNGYICSREESSSGPQVRVCCEQGYVLEGTALFDCDPVSERWEPTTLPQCLPVRCPSLSTPLHGNTSPPSCNNSVYQTNCWVSCDHGYSLSHGNGLLTCSDDGSWSSAPPSCILTDCGSPPSAGSLMVSHSSTLVGSEATYTCSHCHSIGVGNESVMVVCGSDGTWEGPKPMCTPVYCPELTPPLYGSVHSTSLQCGAHVRYSCELGFNLIGDSEAECLNDGTWSSPTPQCTSVACRAPEIAGSNFAESNSSFVFGSVIEVECSACRVKMVEGVMTDEGTLTCTTEGQWDKPLPTCQWATCPLPGLLTNGTIEPLGQLYYCGTTISFSCHSGFRLNGTNSSMCTVNQTWTEEFPTCEEIPEDHCSSPPVPRNHSHFCGSTLTRYLHSMVVYCCDEGYQFDSGLGAVKLTCEENKEWNGNAPTCIPITCAIPDLPAGLVISHVQLDYTQGEDYHYGSPLASEYSYGTRLTMSCVSVELRHSVNGPRHLTCGKEGQWDHPVPTCQATGCSIACEVPAPPRNGRIVSVIRPGVGTIPRTSSNTYQGLIIGDVAIFMCNRGYYLHGSGSRQCGSNGVWSGQTASCLKFDQPRSRFIYRNPRNITVWDTADSAHFLSMDTIYLACQISTEGVGIAMPIRKIAGPLLNERNARTRAYGSRFRSTQLAIQPRNTAGGHSMAGVYLCEIRSPHDDSLLVRKTLTVHINDRLCPTPKPLLHGRLITMGTVPGSCIHYQCNRGHTLIGSNNRVCLRDSTWTGTLPVCLSVFNATCSSAPPVDNASLTTPTPTGSYGINATVTYECDNGYTLVGGNSRQCLGGDKWSEGGPRCVENK